MGIPKVLAQGSGVYTIGFSGRVALLQNITLPSEGYGAITVFVTNGDVGAQPNVIDSGGVYYVNPTDTQVTAVAIYSGGKSASDAARFNYIIYSMQF